MGQVLYRKYRPRSFDEVIGQDHIVKTLKSAIKQNRLSHAYLFTGPRGVGKTSVARILAYAANGLKYGDGPVHLDIIEIDGASNRRIEEVRDLREKVNILPAIGKYKVYIIDEVHMLTKEAFNALLKTLEEPPAHCIFILATTEAHKLPETIISRTQRFSFRPITPLDAKLQLQSIAKQEKIKAEPAALELLALHGDSSFRDSISLLDQLGSSSQKITEELVSSVLGLPPSQSTTKLLTGIENGSVDETLKVLEELRDKGVSPTAIAKSLGVSLRAELSDGNSSPWRVKLLKELLEIGGSGLPQERLEIALLEAASNNNSEPAEPILPPEVEPQVEHTTSEKPKQKPVAVKTEQASKVNSSKLDLDLIWPKILSEVKVRQPSLSMALKRAKPTIKNGSLRLNFEFPLYKNKVGKADNKRLIGAIFKEIAGIAPLVECVVEKDAFADSIKETSVPAKPPIQTISNIFGGGEVLES